MKPDDVEQAFHGGAAVMPCESKHPPYEEEPCESKHPPYEENSKVDFNQDADGSEDTEDEDDRPRRVRRPRRSRARRSPRVGVVVAPVTGSLHNDVPHSFAERRGQPTQRDQDSGTAVGGRAALKMVLHLAASGTVIYCMTALLLGLYYIRGCIVAFEFFSIDEDGKFKVKFTHDWAFSSSILFLTVYLNLFIVSIYVVPYEIATARGPVLVLVVGCLVTWFSEYPPMLKAILGPDFLVVGNWPFFHGVLFYLTFNVLWAREIAKGITKKVDKNTNFVRSWSVLLAIVAIIALLGILSGFYAVSKNGRNDKTRLNWVIVVYPIVREVLFMIFTNVCYRIRGVTNPEVAIFFLLLYFSWIGRFMVAGFTTYSGVTAAIILQAFVEIFYRLTHRARDRVIRVLLREHRTPGTEPNFWGAVKDAIMDTQDEVTDEASKDYRQRLARAQLFFMIAEYPALVGAGLLIVIAEPARMWFDLGYTGFEPLNYELLIYGLVTQFVMEIVVDWIIVMYESHKHHVDIMGQWKSLDRKAFAVICIMSVTSYQNFLTATLRLPPDACPSDLPFCECIMKTPAVERYSVHAAFCVGAANATTNATAL